MFRFEPGESDPPSTPNTRRSVFSNPSTTPAGPPPSYREPPSFTPSGPPPPQVYGSSEYGSGTSRAPLASGRGTAKNSLFARAASGQRAEKSVGGYSFDAAQASTFPSSPPQVISVSDDEESTGEEEPDGRHHTMEGVRLGGSHSIDLGKSPSKLHAGATPRGTKRTRYGEPMQDTEPIELPDIRGFAKGLVAAQAPVKLHEDDQLILGTEKVMQRLEQIGDLGQDESAITLTEIAQDLRLLWAKYGELSKPELKADVPGPSRDASPVVKANFVASLLLQLYHPSSSGTEPPPPPPLFGRSSQVVWKHQPQAQIPKMLFNWLNQYHDPGSSLLEGVQNQVGGYGLAPDFWDAVYAGLFRGRFHLVIDLLEGSNFAEIGRAGDEDGQTFQYTDSQKKNINAAISHAISLLKSCPAVRDNNWDIKGDDWAMFRYRVNRSIQSLREFAEGEDESDLGRSLSNSRLGRSAASRTIPSALPEEIFEPLTDMYTLLLGRPEDLMKSAFSWLEGAIGLAAWWDGEEEESPPRGLAPGSKSVVRSQHSRPADVTPALAYRQKLAETFVYALEEGGEPGEPDDTFDSSDPVHIALGCLLTGDVAAAIDVMRGWSITLTSATVELGSIAGWLPGARTISGDVMDGLDNSDLMVLSYGQQDSASTSEKDELLIKYADLLTARATLTDADGTPVDGWVLALHLLARLDAYDAADGKVAKIVDLVPLDSPEQVDKLLNLCNELDFEEQAVRISEKYAESLVEESTKQKTARYGDSLLYFARARQPKKMKEVLDMLTSLCLLHSIAYPPAAELDDRLRALLEQPKETLSELANTDLEAAHHLATSLSGYANMRKFYDIRDSGTRAASKRGNRPADADAEQALTPHGRKRAAAACLLAAVASARSSIRGGLYDPSAAAAAVMPVETLLALLGEALPLLSAAGPTARLLSLAQLHALLAAAEDLHACPPRLYAAADDFVRAARDAFRGPAAAPTPRALLLRKSVSALTASSEEAFSLVGSSMLLSGEQESAVSDEDGSMVVLKEGDGGRVKRGWDWRKGLSAEANGETVLAILRDAAAREIAIAFARGEEGV